MLSTVGTYHFGCAICTLSFLTAFTNILSGCLYGSRVSKGAKYKFADNPWIALCAQTTDRLICSQVQSKDKLQVSGIALAS